VAPNNLTPLEIYKILPQTNCRKCILPSCLAFAAAVVAGQKKLQDCPDLAKSTVEKFARQFQGSASKEIDQAEFIDKLERKLSAIDLEKVAPLIGAVCKDNMLRVNSLGKDFVVDKHGGIVSQCHIISWVKVPLLSYITNKTHGDITGKWISFREIKGGIDWQGLFSRRCEDPLRRLADENPDLLGDIIDMFCGETIDWYEADIALILHPLPKFPILICYQRADDDLESELTIFFDECCELNLHIKSIFILCAGLVQMFTKLAEHHL
jgi:hypothetical protein